MSQTLTLRPTHVLAAMADRARKIADSLGYEAPRYHRLALVCREEISRRRTAERIAVAHAEGHGLYLSGPAERICTL